jgi:1-deoxy-D-xylulose-5-phosphate synthase
MLDGVRVTRLGMPDRYVEHGTQRQLHDEIGIGPDGLVAAARALVSKTAEAA